MTLWMDSFIDRYTQCWGCAIFDNLFGVVSAAAAAMYTSMTYLAITVLAIFLAFYVLHSVWNNLYEGGKDATYMKYFRPVIINSIVVLGLLSVGVAFPRLITRITIEPVAHITLIYSQAMMGQTADQVQIQVPYQPRQMRDDGFYRPELRNTVIQLMQTSTTQFQAMMTMGMHIMDGAFTWRNIRGIGSLIQHIIMFFIGLTLVWQFFKLFIKFCLYFIDVIINMSLFAFFFPVALVFFVIKESESSEWVKEIGNGLMPKFIMRLINSIITLATVVITYVVILVLMAKFFAANGVDAATLAYAIMSGEIYRGDISSDNIAAMTLMSMIVLVYLVQYIAGEIPNITKMITESFGLDGKDGNKVGEELGENITKMGAATWAFATAKGTDAVKNMMGIETPDTDKPKEEKKE